MSFTPIGLSLRGLRYYWRHHLGTLLGVALCTAVLSGALMVGGVVHDNLTRQAHERLGSISHSMFTADRFFTQSLAEKNEAEPVILVRATVANADRSRRVNQVQIHGIRPEFASFFGEDILSPDEGEIFINQRLAAELNAGIGDRVLLRIAKPSSISREAPFAEDDDLTVTVSGSITKIVPNEAYGNFSLSAQPVPASQVFMPLGFLQEKLEREGRANLMVRQNPATKAVEPISPSLADLEIETWKAKSAKEQAPLQLASEVIEDADLLVEESRELEALARYRQAIRLAGPNPGVSKKIASLSEKYNVSNLKTAPPTGEVLITDRIFFDPSFEENATAASARSVLTYFVNRIETGTGFSPYAMVSALEPSQFGLPELAPGEAAINEWLAGNLSAGIGDQVAIRYFILGEDRAMFERTNTFTIGAICPLDGVVVNPALMPRFPGIDGEENCRDWDPSMPINLDDIRDDDEEYWDNYQGAPKVIISLQDGQAMWSNAYGKTTSLWLPPEADLPAITAASTPEGFQWRNVAADAEASMNSGVGKDLGGYFAGMSWFLILSAIILCILLMGFCLEHRANQWDLMRQLGFGPKAIQKILRREFFGVSIIGILLGSIGSIAYMKFVLSGLSGAWRGALGATPLRFDSSYRSELWIGGLIMLVLMWGVILFSSRIEPPDNVVASQQKPASKKAMILFMGSLFVCLILLFLRPGDSMQMALTYFGAGSLGLIGGLAGFWILIKKHRDVHGRGIGFAFKNLAVRPWRSLAVAAMLASGIFLVFSVGVFQQAVNPEGTGGFRYLAESTQPLFHSLNTSDGRNKLNLDEELFEGISTVAMRSTDGEEASCLNLNRASEPRVLGVVPEEFQGRFELASGTWAKLLDQPLADGAIPAVGDLNSLKYALKAGVGDQVLVGGNALQIVGSVNQTLLQGNLIISDRHFKQAFPDIAGKRLFLLDAPADNPSFSETLTKELRDYGLTVQTTNQRLADLYAVQNTYIQIFQILGGMGMMLGCLGMAILCLRSLLERKEELAVMRAIGFTRRHILNLVSIEQLILLLGGLGIGWIAGVASTLRYAVLTGAGFMPSKLLLLFVGCLLIGIFGIILVASTQLSPSISGDLTQE